MKIRTYLLVFALAILLPMIAFSAIAVLAFDRQQRALVERSGVETARALVNAVDRELNAMVTTLATLAKLLVSVGVRMDGAVKVEQSIKMLRGQAKGLAGNFNAIGAAAHSFNSIAAAGLAPAAAQMVMVPAGGWLARPDLGSAGNHVCRRHGTPHAAGCWPLVPGCSPRPR